MKYRTKVILCILVALLGMILMISHLFEKEETINTINNTTNSVIKEFIDVSSTTTTKTIKTPKKVDKTTKKTTKKVSTVKNVATASKQEYMAYAKEVGNYNDTQMKCLDYLWTHESNWNANSVNNSSGACGIPQAYPCKRIVAEQGSNDWKAQIRWGVNYISGRYKNPCSAWNHFKNKRWY